MSNAIQWHLLVFCPYNLLHVLMSQSTFLVYMSIASYQTTAFCQCSFIKEMDEWTNFSALELTLTMLWRLVNCHIIIIFCINNRSLGWLLCDSLNKWKQTLTSKWSIMDSINSSQNGGFASNDPVSGWKSRSGLSKQGSKQKLKSLLTILQNSLKLILH